MGFLVVLSSNESEIGGRDGDHQATNVRETETMGPKLEVFDIRDACKAEQLYTRLGKTVGFVVRSWATWCRCLWLCFATGSFEVYGVVFQLPALVLGWFFPKVDLRGQMV